MNFLQVAPENGIATITLNRGKVNAINQALVDQLADCLSNLENDTGVKAVVLTGRDKFFSFGFDIPEFLNLPPESFATFLAAFTTLYSRLFMFPKPVIAALNGHTIAGGCILATACDYRLMVSGRARISLNEITFGSSLFAGAIDILRFVTGSRNAEKILYTGAMFSAEDAQQLGLVDQVCPPEQLEPTTRTVAEKYAAHEGPAFRSMKNLVRRPVVEQMVLKEQDSIQEFLEIWNSDLTWSNLKKIEIRS